MRTKKPLKRLTMKLKSLDIGRLTTKNNVFVAPLAGFSDYAFRYICSSLGAGLCFTEMISAKGLHFSPAQTSLLTKTSDVESVKCAQIFGCDPFFMREACESKYLEDFDIIDVNMGCPVPKVYNNGEGSALLNNLPLAEKIVEECAKSGKIITVKTRLGVKRGESVIDELAKRVEGAGAQMLTVHARYREDFYSGTPDFAAVKNLKKLIRIPVIFNGGIFTKEDAENAMEKSGADGTMLARGALEKPWLISELTGGVLPNKKQLIKTHISLLKEFMPDEAAAKYFRKQAALYLKNARNAKILKVRAFAAKTCEELIDVFEQAEIK